ncbi:hypothetical protein PF005_g2916 [Phytophthora fragariae]|uniref:Uncharacterized protein n=1 Tax=Phytophthora fragariae TaxID=53985 RepID=A0A6A3TNT4_9STRA|nr:hypothetical protein PF009_g3073 [Phytophthora fragariae]KAE9016183.1 hypothetical protein PF011_g7278 [Phytophthora fragariae]KAE9113246.1 hypothetical protein PF010_g10152 [Phytophthora fragariae]KAE9139714.1 hypothetical protein PF007_g906 [Phytophthora fragariae]KAE9153427.1 hypothetical protein PF006_g2439 [Phytophthora fragariae]
MKNLSSTTTTLRLRENVLCTSGEILLFCRSLEVFLEDKLNPNSQKSWAREFLRQYTKADAVLNSGNDAVNNGGGDAGSTGGDIVLNSGGDAGGDAVNNGEGDTVSTGGDVVLNAGGDDVNIGGGDGVTIRGGVVLNVGGNAVNNGGDDFIIEGEGGCKFSDGGDAGSLYED